MRNSPIFFYSFLSYSRDVMEDEDNRALRPDGTLKDASEMSWPNSPSEETSLAPATNQSPLPEISRNHLPMDDVGRQSKRMITAPQRFLHNGLRQPSFVTRIAGEYHTMEKMGFY